MPSLRMLAISALAAAMVASSPMTRAQVSINIGPQPVCPYGYYDYAPYNCSPYGYYGPEWFNGGGFIGAGPWFHGRGDFYGHVDNGYDPRFGYHGPYPARGDRAFNHFHGQDMRDGRGHDFHGGGDRGDRR